MNQSHRVSKHLNSDNTFKNLSYHLLYQFLYTFNINFSDITSQQMFGFSMRNDKSDINIIAAGIDKLTYFKPEYIF